MKYFIPMVMLIVFITTLNAELPEHHEHVGKAEVKFNYEFLDFKNSKQKDDGRRYGMTLDFQNSLHHFQLYSEHTDTHTKPVIPKDLSVNKYAFKYQYTMSKVETFSFTYMNISDNLIDEVDNGSIYGFGYRYKSVSFMQYYSDYKHFNVYQSDIKFGVKKQFSDFLLKGALIGKYIHLQDRKSNSFSKKADQDYFTTGLKLHIKYDDWHAAAVGYVDDRIFTVMNEGLRVQHHAMEFEKSYLFSLGREIDDLFINLFYIKQYATEVPIENKNVEVTNIAINVSYQF